MADEDVNHRALGLYRMCQRCKGEGLEPHDETEGCAVCRGQGRLPGRPDDWPEVGAMLRRPGTMDYAVVQPGEAFAMVAINFAGEHLRVHPEKIGPGLEWELDA